MWVNEFDAIKCPLSKSEKSGLIKWLAFVFAIKSLEGVEMFLMVMRITPQKSFHLEAFILPMGFCNTMDELENFYLVSKNTKCNCNGMQAASLILTLPEFLLQCVQTFPIQISKTMRLDCSILNNKFTHRSIILRNHYSFGVFSAGIISEKSLSNMNQWSFRKSTFILFRYKNFQLLKVQLK